MYSISGFRVERDVCIYIYMYKYKHLSICVYKYIYIYIHRITGGVLYLGVVDEKIEITIRSSGFRVQICFSLPPPPLYLYARQKASLCLNRLKYEEGVNFKGLVQEGCGGESMTCLLHVQSFRHVEN